MWCVAIINLKPSSMWPTSFPFCSLTHPYITPSLDKLGRKGKKKTTACLMLKNHHVNGVRGIPMSFKRCSSALRKSSVGCEQAPWHITSLETQWTRGEWIWLNPAESSAMWYLGEENNQSKWHDWWINLKIEGQVICPLHRAQVKQGWEVGWVCHTKTTAIKNMNKSQLQY